MAEAEEAEGGASQTPLTDLLLINCDHKRLDAWVRRFARSLQSAEKIADNDDLDDVKLILEGALQGSCASEWEVENLKAVLRTTDGSTSGLEDMVAKLKKRMQEKANKGVGSAAGKSRYGPLAVALSNTGAVAHKCECEPECVFKADTARLAPLWKYLDPAPKSKAPREATKWELRLTRRIWKDDEDDKFRFTLVREKLSLKRDDTVSAETLSGSYSWEPFSHMGDVYDDWTLELEMPLFGNTNRHTGEGSPLFITYRRDVDNRKHLKYVEHQWGRRGTSEMWNFDHMFPPFLEEFEEEDMDEDAVGSLIERSLRRLQKGAQAGIEEHEPYIPGTNSPIKPIKQGE